MVERPPQALWLGLVALSLVEYLLLGVMVDSGPLAEHLAFLHYVPTAVMLAVAIGAAVLLLGWRRLGEGVAELSLATAGGRGVGRPLGLHLLIYGAFFALTLRLFGAPERMRGDLRLWVALWGLGALLTALTLAAVALPLGRLSALAFRGRRLLLAALAVGLLGAAAGQLTLLRWEPLSRLAMRGASLLLSPFLGDLIADPETLELGTPRFSVFIAYACSGVEGLGLGLAFTSCWLLWSRRELLFPRALLLLPLAAVAAVVTNVVRIAALVLVGHLIDGELAMGAFHSRAGWILFCAVALGLAAFSRRSPFFARAPADGGAQEWNPAAAWLSPLLSALAVALCVGGPGFDPLYGLRPLAALLALLVHRRGLPSLPRAISWWAPLLGLAAFALWMALEPAPGPAGQALQQSLAALSPLHRAGWLVLRCAGSVLVVPLIEEMAFRGFLLRRLVSADFTAVEARAAGLWPQLLSSLAFGALHQRWLAGALTGLLFARAYRQRGRLADAVVAHAVANALVALAVLGGGRYQLWT